MPRWGGPWGYRCEWLNKPMLIWWLLRSDFTSLCRHIGLPRLLLSPSLHRSPCTIWSGLVLVYDMIWSCSRVRYDLVLFLCTIWSSYVLMYDINLRATHTTILSIRGVAILIYLVSSTTDSIRQRVVLFKLVPVPTSDPKSEFLWQSSLQLRRTYRPVTIRTYRTDLFIFTRVLILES